MIHLALALHRLVTYVTTLGGTVLGPATLHETAAESASTATGSAHQTGRLVLNADDWGRDRETTDRILECFLSGTVSSASAMVFMADSERAAGLAREHNLDAGLHVNLTGAFSAMGTSPRLQEHQERIRRYLHGHRFAQVVFHPGLSRAFRYVVNAQLEEYQRLYGRAPQRLDGHHHMHLSANVLLAKLLPAGTIVRPSFSFYAGEKGAGNRVYRALINGLLARRHRSADYFFSLPPLEPGERLRRIFALARTKTVEIETHPINPEEYRFLTGGGIQQFLGSLEIARSFAPAVEEDASARRSIQDRLASFLPFVFAFGATVYQSILQLSEYS
jgi:chitin disaccharide deacetylase